MTCQFFLVFSSQILSIGFVVGDQKEVKKSLSEGGSMQRNSTSERKKHIFICVSFLLILVLNSEKFLIPEAGFSAVWFLYS